MHTIPASIPNHNRHRPLRPVQPRRHCCAPNTAVICSTVLCVTVPVVPMVTPGTMLMLNGTLVMPHGLLRLPHSPVAHVAYVMVLRAVVLGLGLALARGEAALLLWGTPLGLVAGVLPVVLAVAAAAGLAAVPALTC